MTGNPLLAYHVDLKRPMWTRAYLDTTVDRLLGWGFNALVYELEDKLRFTRHPQMAHPDAWSPPQTAEFVAACRVKGMEVIPLMQSLGHAEAVVGRPEFAHLREHPDCLNQFDPLSLEARALILELFDEVLNVFHPAPYFHIGGDETWRLGTSERHRATVAEIGIGQVYLRHMLPILEHVWQRGVRPMIWADMLLTYPDTLAQLPDYVVLVDWEYGRTTERARAVRIWGEGQRTWPQIAELARAGDSRAMMVEQFGTDKQTAHDGLVNPYYPVDALRARGLGVVTASAVRSGADGQAIPRPLHVANVTSSTRAGSQRGLGELVTSWTVRHNHPEVTMPALYAAPYALRHAGPLDDDALFRAYTLDAFGVEAPELRQIQRLAAVGFPFSQTTTIRHASHQFAHGQDPAALLRQETCQPGVPVEMFSRGVAPWEGKLDTTGDDDPLAAAIKDTEAALEGVAEARRLLTALRARAPRGTEVLDFWEEGVDLAKFYGTFALAALCDRLEAERGPLLDEIATLRQRSRVLWRRTFSEGSLQTEMEVRYGFHEACLGGADLEVARRIAMPVQPPFHLADPNVRPFGTLGE